MHTCTHAHIHIYVYLCIYCVYVLQIQEAGFDILSNEERTLTEAEMQVFYQHRAGEVSSSAPIGPAHSLFSLPALC